MLFFEVSFVVQQGERKLFRAYKRYLSLLLIQYNKEIILKAVIFC
jgi:hypothetical protein